MGGYRENGEQVLLVNVTFMTFKDNHVSILCCRLNYHTSFLDGIEVFVMRSGGLIHAHVKAWPWELLGTWTLDVLRVGWLVSSC